MRVPLHDTHMHTHTPIITLLFPNPFKALLNFKGFLQVNSAPVHHIEIQNLLKSSDAFSSSVASAAHKRVWITEENGYMCHDFPGRETEAQDNK